LNLLYFKHSGRDEDVRNFEPAVASEDCIIRVKGYKNPPFAEEVESVAFTAMRWNFRRKKKEDRPKASSASA